MVQISIWLFVVVLFAAFFFGLFLMGALAATSSAKWRYKNTRLTDEIELLKELADNQLSDDG